MGHPVVLHGQYEHFHHILDGACYLVGSDAAVVGSLGSGEAALGPAEGVLVLVQDGVLLLDAEPGVLVLMIEWFEIKITVPFFLIL